MKVLLSKNVQFPNYIPIADVRSTEVADVVIRQFLQYNLFQRLATMPYITNIEKKWICFQLLFGLNKLHNIGICHGNINFDNILLLSNLTPYLSDISVYKYAYLKKNDIRTYTYFFANKYRMELDPIYLAPERFIDGEVNYSYKTTPEMDIFSMGVVISQIFLECNLLTMSDMFDYKNGKISLEDKLSPIKNVPLKNLLIKMMELDPKKRIKIGNALKFFSDQVCPIPIPKFLLHMNIMINCYDYYKGDLLIGLIYKHWTQIWKCLYLIDNTNIKIGTIPKIKNKLNYKVIGKLLKRTSIYKVLIADFPLIFSIFNNEDIELDESLLFSLEHTPDDSSDCTLIIIKYLLSSLLTVKYQSTIIVGIEMIEHLSHQMNQNYIIRLIIPYIVSLQKNDTTVNLYAMNTIIRLLQLINENELKLKSYEDKFFSHYIFDFFINLYTKGDYEIKCAVASKINILIDLEMKFLYCSSISRYKRNVIQRNEEQSKTNENSENNEKQMQSYSKQNFEQIGPSQINAEELLDIYQNNLDEFKVKLAHILDNILAENNYEIIIILVRQFPKIFLLYGNMEIQYFSKFVIMPFNKKNYQIDREIMKIFPNLVLLLGESSINSLFIPCIDILMNKIPDESTIYEMVHSIFILSKMDFINSNKSLELFLKVFGYIAHPNIRIKKLMIDFFQFLIKKVPQCDLYPFLWKEISNVNVKFISIHKSIFHITDFGYINRSIYNMIYNEIDIDSFLRLENTNIFLKNQIIQLSKTKKNEELERTKTNKKVMDWLRSVIPEASVGKEFYNILQKEISKKNIEKKEDIECLENQIIGQFILYCSYAYSNNNNWLYDSQDSTYLRLKYLIKTLKLYVNEKVLNNININEPTSNIVLAEGKTPKPPQSKFNEWRPDGKLISTTIVDDFYQIMKIYQIEDKLSYLSTQNTIISILNNGDIYIHELNENDIEYKIRKKSKLTINNENNFSLNKQNINYIPLEKNVHVSSPLIVMSINQKLYLINIADEKTNNQCKIIKSNKEITSISKYDEVHSSLLLGHDDSMLSLFDIRTKQNIPLAGSKFGKNFGVITKIEYSNDYQKAIVGTSKGCLLVYDFRMNVFIENYYVYPHNDYPITGIIPFTPRDKSEYDLFSLNLNWEKYKDEYYFVYTSNPSYDICLWNLATLNCDLLFKIHTMRENEAKNLEIQIPEIIKTPLKSFGYNYKYYQNILPVLGTTDSIVELNKRQKSIANNGILCSLCPYDKERQCNYPYIMVGGKDRIVRYWDFSKQNLNSTNNQNSYFVINNDCIESAFFTTSTPDKTSIIQSNEYLKSSLFDSNLCSENHIFSINDIQSIHNYNDSMNYLLSCSDDGTLKLWK